MSVSSTKRGVLHLGESTTIIEGRVAEDTAVMVPQPKRQPPSKRAKADSLSTSSTRQVAVHVDEAAKVLDLDDRFLDEGEIGRGGMSAVHRVYERSLSRTVALKALPNELSHDIVVRDRFLMEAQVTGQLEHPNIVPVYELGSDDAGTFFFTMRLITGRSLSEVITEAPDRKSNTWLEHVWLEDALDVFLRVCDALSFAHSRGVIHRDIKPSNIMVGEHGQVYLVDWGIAKVIGEEDAPSSRAALERLRTTVQPEEAQGLVMGTFAYMSPEQAWGDVDAIDARTDVFGLGAVLYRILTGRPPYAAKKVSDMHHMARMGRIPDPRPDIRSPLVLALSDVAMKAMQPSKEDRHASVAELKAAVQKTLRGRGRFATTRFPAGSIVIREGSAGDAAYIVKSGRCRVFRHGERGPVQLHELGEGDVFGETAVFTGEPRNASVEAITDVELAVVPGETLAETLGLDTWSGAFVRVLGQRLTEGNRRAAELSKAVQHRDLALGAMSVFARSQRMSMPIMEMASILRVDVARIAEAVDNSAVLSIHDVSGETQIFVRQQ